MDSIIKDHHGMYLSLFPNKVLTTKFHIMLHYSMIVKLSGPLRNSMVFRFEAKHQRLKEYARVCFSRKDISLSICNKFCLNFAQFLTQNRNRFQLLKDIQSRGSIEFLCSKTNCKYISSLRYKGTRYAIGDIITQNNIVFIIRGISFEENEELAFAWGEVLFTEKSPALKCLKLVNYSGIFNEINLASISSSPVNMHIVNGVKYIILKH